MDDLVWVVQDAYGISIEIFDVDFEATHLRGYLERGEKAASIYIREDQSDFYKRLTITKELVHIVMDEKEDWSVDALTTLDGLIISHVLGEEDDNTDEPDGVIVSERLAVVGAAEILFPREIRAASKKEVDEGKTIKAIASELEIPDAAASWILTERYTELVDTVLASMSD